MTAPASGIGGVQITASATAAATKVAKPRYADKPRYHISACRLAGAAASNARPAAAAGISLYGNATAAICLTAAAGLAASFSRHAGITGGLRHAAGLSRFLGPGSAVTAISAAASTVRSCAATSTAWSLAKLFPIVGTLEPGNVLPGTNIGQAGRISAFGPSTGLAAFTARSEGQLIHAGRQEFNGVEWSRTGAAAPAAPVF